jgi:hypothetical protein
VLSLFAVRVHAADDLLSLDASSINDASISIEENSLDIDVEGLAKDASGEKSDKAIEACFRRFGYGCGYNYGCYNHCYGYGYHYGCYNPCYYTYRPCFYRPVCQVSYVTYPVYSYYWGCY